MHFQVILTIGIYLIPQTCFHCKNLLCFIVSTTCDIFICNTTNGRKCYNAHFSITLMDSKNSVLSFSINTDPQKQYENSPCPLPLMQNHAVN